MTIDSPRDPATRNRVIRQLVWAGVGLGAALLGLLPWIVTGMRLPLQNLWATPTLPDEMPFVLLPFNQYTITTLVGIVVTAYAAAAIVVRHRSGRRPRFALLVVAVTILAVHLLATVQTTLVVLRGLEDRAASTVYVVGLLAVIVVAEIVGLLVLLAVARGSRPLAVVALAVAAVSTGFWLNALISPLGGPALELTSPALAIAHWVPAILVGVAIAWGGIHFRGRLDLAHIVAAVIALLVLWVAPALATAVSAAVGSRALLPYPLEMLDYGWGVLRLALFMPELAVPPLLVAIVVAAVGITVRILRPRALPES